MVHERWNDATHGADLRNRVASSEVRLDQLDPDTLFNIAATHYRNTIPQGAHARNTVIQRMRKVLLRIRSELEQQGSRRRGEVQREILLLFQIFAHSLHSLLWFPIFFSDHRHRKPPRKPRPSSSSSSSSSSRRRRRQRRR